MNDQRLFAAALLDPDAPCPTGLAAWNGSDPTRRFAVYRNNVVVMRQMWIYRTLII